MALLVISFTYNLNYMQFIVLCKILSDYAPYSQFNYTTY